LAQATGLSLPLLFPPAVHCSVCVVAAMVAALPQEGYGIVDDQASMMPSCAEEALILTDDAPCRDVASRRFRTPAAVAAAVLMAAAAGCLAISAMSASRSRSAAVSGGVAGQQPVLQQQWSMPDFNAMASQVSSTFTSAKSSAESAVSSAQKSDSSISQAADHLKEKATQVQKQAKVLRAKVEGPSTCGPLKTQCDSRVCCGILCCAEADYECCGEGTIAPMCCKNGCNGNFCAIKWP